MGTVALAAVDNEGDLIHWLGEKGDPKRFYRKYEEKDGTPISGIPDDLNNFVEETDVPQAEDTLMIDNLEKYKETANMYAKKYGQKNPDNGDKPRQGQGIRDIMARSQKGERKIRLYWCSNEDCQMNSERADMKIFRSLK